ncbi:hypothetical protein HHL22_08965 [Hymenobacter sp. RP-2-7]|uniref:Lipoprotein n=1 Tax=Hymenobacter polaris TaxID=2682546 RepID=A0A7Y0ADF6_9BACT|nr:hypothetical protein [Hymenobacter polaris]NML65333.1 hypothetical protein [Hymenobacter polaris]
MQILLYLLLVAMLGSCCLGECPGYSESATVYFQFSADTLVAGQGFRQAEVRSAYVVSYYDARLLQPQDTVRWLAASATGRKLLIIDRRRFALGFVGDSTRGIAGSYRVLVPAAKQRYDIRRIMVPVERSPCKNGCDRAKSVSLQLNGQPVSFNVPEPPLAEAVVLRR